MRRHVLWKRGDEGVPSVVIDRNGDVMLGLCRVCGQAEADLAPECPGLGLGLVRTLLTAARCPEQIGEVAIGLRPVDARRILAALEVKQPVHVPPDTPTNPVVDTLRLANRITKALYPDLYGVSGIPNEKVLMLMGARGIIHETLNKELEGK